MKCYLKMLMLALFAGGGILFQSCELLTSIGPPRDSTSTIKQGVFGYVEFWEGDFMPTVPPASGRGKITPVARTLVVHTATRFDSVVQVGYSPFYSSINTPRVATTSSNDLGFFQVELEPGEYSFFVIENSLYYANGSDGEGYICPVIVRKDSVSFLRFNITYRATF